MSESRKQPLREKIRSLRETVFWKDPEKPRPTPSYRHTYHDILSSRYPSGVMPIADVLRDDFPHPSTFQRLVAKEARRRRDLREQE